MSQIDTGIRRLLASPAVYDFFQDLVGARRARLRWIRECLKPFAGARILDIGCGTAELLKLLPSDIEYTGFDMSPAYIEAARRRYGDRGRFTCERAGVFEASAADGPASGGFDIAMAFGVLHHLDDEEARQVFLGARKALKPGGRMVTFDPAFVPDQSVLARFAASRDRGRNVRSPEAYAALGRAAFPEIAVSVWHGALRIPYDHAILAGRA
ncbi:MAG: Methyltransferase protein [Fibrobacteres bacterium]|nr:Methyltransferase protein [Fibrobacterota bacterium]